MFIFSVILGNFCLLEFTRFFFQTLILMAQESVRLSNHLISPFPTENFSDRWGIFENYKDKKYHLPLGSFKSIIGAKLFSFKVVETSR